MSLTRLHRLVARWRALALLVVGRRDAAEAAFVANLERWPNDAHARASVAYLMAQRGARSQAIDGFRSLVRAHPDRSAADWFNLGFLLDEAGRLEEAEAAFRRAVAIDPQLDRAWYGLGVALIRLDRADEAIAALRRNTELQPMSPYGWYRLAHVHHARHEIDEARRIIARLKEFEPTVAKQLERETGLAG